MDIDNRQAYEKGINDAYTFWEQVLKETPGIGKVLEKRLMETAVKIARRKVKR